jgi:hypothetical protein
MKKIYNIVVFLWLMVVTLTASCTSCHKHNDVIVPDVIPSASSSAVSAGSGGAGGAGGASNLGGMGGADAGPVSSTKSVTVDNTSLEVPFESKVILNSDKNVLASIYLNTTSKVVVILTKESFEGSLEEYLIYNLRGIRATSSVVYGTETLLTNNISYKQIEAGKSAVRIFTWITTKDKFGYTLSCGIKEDSSMKSLCLTILSSLTIK